MRKLLTVIKREFLTRVRTRGFVIATVLMPILILAMLLVPALLEQVKTEEPRTFAVIDATDQIFEPMQNALDQETEKGERLYNLQRLPVPAEHLEAVKDETKMAITEGKWDGLIVIPADVLKTDEVEFYSKNVSNFSMNREIRNAISQVMQEQRIARYGLDPALAKDLIRHVDLKTLRVAKGGKEQQDEGATFILTFVLVMFLYITIILYGASIMNSIIQEKTSRVVEVLTSSVRPFQLMAGKIIGVGSVGLSQFLIWAVAGSLIFAYSGALLGLFGLSNSGASLPAVGLDVVGYFILFFLLGYFLFATLYAGIGAMVNSTEEGQQLQLPVVLCLITSLILLRFIISNPNSTMSLVFSLVPLFSPIIMFARIVVESPPSWQIAAAILILLSTILFFTWAVGKIYRVGILMYGKRPNLPEVLRWIRY